MLEAIHPEGWYLDSFNTNPAYLADSSFSGSIQESDVDIYMFTMPSQNVEISAWFAQYPIKVSGALPDSDVYFDSLSDALEYIDTYGGDEETITFYGPITEDGNMTITDHDIIFDLNEMDVRFGTIKTNQYITIKGPGSFDCAIMNDSDSGTLTISDEASVYCQDIIDECSYGNYCLYWRSLASECVSLSGSGNTLILSGDIYIGGHSSSSLRLDSGSQIEMTGLTSFVAGNADLAESIADNFNNDSSPKLPTEVVANPNNYEVQFLDRSSSEKKTEFVIKDYTYYPITVTNGSSKYGNTPITEATEGTQVNIEADAPEIHKEFKEWTIDLGDVTLANKNASATSFSMPDSSVSLAATYQDIQYTINWYDEDGTTLLSSESAIYGTAYTALHPPTPEKAADDDYHYIFKAWTPEVVDVEANADYVAGYLSEEHSWGTPTYEWSTDNSQVTALIICTNSDCGHDIAETVATSIDETTATCDVPGNTTYTATFSNTLFADQTKDVTGVALGHDWGEPTYVWSDDHSECTATRVCSRDASHMETETAIAILTETPATCLADGQYEYSASFSNAAFTDQSDTVTIPRLAHDMEHHDAVAATCSAEGSVEYWHCSECDLYYSDEEGNDQIDLADTITPIDDEAHDWGEWTTVTEPSYTAEGLKRRVCNIDDSHIEEEPIARLVPEDDDDDDDDYTPPTSVPDEDNNKSVTLVDANGRSITLDTSDAGPDAADPTQQDYSYYGRSEDPTSVNNQVYEKLDVITDIVAGEALGLQDTDLMGAVFTLPTVNASEQDDYDVTNVQEADYVAPNCLADGNTLSIIEAGTTAGSEFYNVNPATADKTIKYAELKPGDVVRTTAFNGIYVTSLDKKAANYEAEAKTLKSNIFASFVAFDMDHPEVFWLTGSTKVRVTSVTKGDKSTAYFFLVLADDKDFNMLQPDYKAAGSLEAGIKLRDDSAAKILASVTASIPANADRKTKVQALNKWLTLNNEYNRTPDLTTIGYIPHRSISALAGSTGTNGPVCDGYSRAFKLLCDRLGVPCMLQCGNAFVKAGAAPEYHMWNQIQMEDGNWYGVDICWNDPLVNGAPAPVSGKENESWLFAGRDTMIGGLKFADSHQVQAQSDGDGTYFSSLNIYLSGFDSSLITGFEDVGLGDWFYDYVRALCDKGIMEGTSAATFRPYATSNRAQIAMTLYRLAGKPAADTENVFTDVNEADWFFDPVLWAKANEITDGVTATSFAPLQNITREQLVTLLYRYAESIGKADEASESVLDRFSDKAEVSAYAVTPMAWAVENGIVDGKSSTRLAPQDTANRAELAAILCRFLDK
ncbi:MAG: S-layer homology domain-containing protein [Firmicutes bacterium]|nr:S-layer homology domain-containing protein [Bacillota bacterium]